MKFIPYTLYGNFTEKQEYDLKELDNILPPTDNPFGKAWIITKHSVNLFSIKRTDWKGNIRCENIRDILTKTRFYSG